MSDYKITHVPDDDHPWKVVDDGLVFDDFDREEDAEKFIHEAEQTQLFCDQVETSIEAFATIMEVTPIEFVYMVEQHMTRTIRGVLG